MNRLRKRRITIYDQEGLYLDKRYVLPIDYSHTGNAGLHRFDKSDDRSYGLHDHPYWFVAVTLFGKGTEMIRGEDGNNLEIPLRRFRLYPPRKLHAVRIQSEHIWTFVIHGPRIRVWGFDNGEEWIPYYKLKGLSLDGRFLEQIQMAQMDMAKGEYRWRGRYSAAADG